MIGRAGRKIHGRGGQLRIVAQVTTGGAALDRLFDRRAFELGRHFRHEISRRDRIDLNAVLRQFHSIHFRKADHSVFGGGITHLQTPARRHQPPDRGNVDDLSGALRLHDSPGVLGAEERSGEIHRQDVLPRGAIELQHRFSIHHAGVVDQYVESSESTDDGRDRPLDRSFIADIEFDRGRIRAEFGDNFCIALHAPRADRHPRTGLPERHGDCKPDSTVAAGHQRHFSGQRE